MATADGELAVGKALSTPGRVDDEVLGLAGRCGAPPRHQRSAELLGETDVFAHGTTIGLNALLTRPGPRSAC